MIFIMFSIEDVKAGSFSPPICVQAPVIARRMFAELCNNKEQVQYKYPGDFRLVEVGRFDEKTGRVATLDEFVVHGFGSDFKETVNGHS